MLPGFTSGDLHRTRVHGELALECAQLYYYYGNALLSQAESSGDVFGQVVSDGTSLSLSPSDTHNR